MSKIDELKRELYKAEQEEEAKKRKKQSKVNDFCIGKVFKSIRTGNESAAIHYKYVKDYIRYKDEKIMFGTDHNTLVADEVMVTYSVDGYVMHYGELKYLGIYNNPRLPIKKHYAKGDEISPQTRYYYSYFSPREIRPDNSIIDNSNNTWYECSLEEYVEARDYVLEMNKIANERVKKFNTIHPLYYDKNPDLVFRNEAIHFPLLTELLKKVNNKEIDLNDFTRIAKATTEFYHFYNNELSELAQYNRNGDKSGMNLTIEAGDDGTDYEPYVTKYILTHVDIDWRRILYLIRHKLDSVIETAKDLEKISEVYDVSNWSVSWFGRYDVTFESATLNKHTLKLVNNIIKKHLKQ